MSIGDSDHVCIRIQDHDVFLAMERLPPLVFKWLMYRIRENPKTGTIEGVQCGEEEYCAISVVRTEESIGYLKSIVVDIESFTRYTK